MEQLNPATQEMVELLIESDFVGTERIAKGGATSVEYVNRISLMESATDKELLALLGHPEGEVTATAFEGLATRDYSELKTILLNLTEGEKMVNYMAGDVYQTIPVLEYAYVYVLQYEFENPNPSVAPVEIGLTPEERAFVENRIKALRQLL